MADFKTFTHRHKWIFTPQHLRFILEELHQQMLAKAIAHQFEAKLLLLDVTNFSLKMQRKYGSGNNVSIFKRSISEAALETMSGLLESISLLSSKEEPKGASSKLKWDLESSVLPLLQQTRCSQNCWSTNSDDDLFKINKVYQYIKLLRRSTPQEWIFKELQAIGNMEFRFAEEQPQDDYAAELADYVLEGNEGTPFAGGYYYGKIKFPPGYPYSPPT